MKPGFQVPLKAHVFPSSQTSKESQHSFSQVSTPRRIPTNSQLSTPGLSVKQLKLSVFSRKRKLGHGNKKKIRSKNEDTSLAFSQQGVFLQNRDDNSVAKDKRSFSLGSKRHKEQYHTIMEAKSKKRMDIKSRNDNIHNKVTKTLTAAAESVTPKHKFFIISKKINKYTFKRTPERQHMRYNSDSHLTPQNASIVANSTYDENAFTPCRTPTKNTSSDILNPTTPRSRRKLLSKLQYFSGEEQISVSSVNKANINGALPISKTSDDLYVDNNSRNKRSSSSEMVYNFPLSPSNDESPVTTKRDKMDFQNKLRNRQVLTVIYKMADEIQELRRRQKELILVQACRNC